MRIEHLIFLIHPLCYEALDPRVLADRNGGRYLERERDVKTRWLQALARPREQPTLFILLGQPASPAVATAGGVRQLLDAAHQGLGTRLTCHLVAEFTGESLEDYYDLLVQQIRDHLRRHDLTIDVATTTSELWGESFEGCVPGYGGAFAERLGLRIPPALHFDMTVFDSRWLDGATCRETMRLPESDIEAWLFECHDGSAAAIFQTRLKSQWLDKRPILLVMDPTRVQVCMKTGFTVWPERAPRKGDPVTPRPFVLTTSDEYWVRSGTLNLADFAELIRSARLYD